MKKCNKCKVEKKLNNFYKDNKTKDGYFYWCKDCRKEYDKNNKKEYYLNNKDKILLEKKQYRENNKDKIKEYHKNNKGRKKEYDKKYSKINKDKISNRMKEYNKNNKEKINLRNNKRKKENIQFKIKCNLRTRLHHALKNDQKVGSAVSDLGCTIDDLKIWLEDQFKDGMSWDNYGNKEDCWSIDHIIPLSKVDLTNREVLLKVCNYKNLQPLWHIDNVKKGNK